MTKSLIDYQSLTDDQLVDVILCGSFGSQVERDAQLHEWSERQLDIEQPPSPTVKIRVGRWFLRLFSRQYRMASGRVGEWLEADE